MRKRILLRSKIIKAVETSSSAVANKQKGIREPVTCFTKKLNIRINGICCCNHTLGEPKPRLIEKNMGTPELLS